MRRESHVRFREGAGVRFPRATRLIVGFQHEWEARQFWNELRERLAAYGLELHPDKTRLLEFGRYAAANRKRNGRGKPETFDFLGFTHVCGKTRRGKFTVLRLTMRKRLRAKLKEINTTLRLRWHDSVPEVGKWLGSIIRGHVNYYGVPLNFRALQVFRKQVTRLWKRALSRRSQKGVVTWTRMYRIAKRWLPPARIVHSYPSDRLCLRT